MFRSLRDKRILLTGASSGIGWHLALELQRVGAKVFATARREDRLQELNQTAQARFPSGKSIHYLAGDITREDFRTSLVETSIQQLGGIDVLINNAGAGAAGNFIDASPDRLRGVMEIDFFAPVELTRLCLNHLKNVNQPALMLIGSVLGHRAVPGKSEYCAAKFALRGWAEAIRCELHPLGIDVIMLSPSTTQSEFFEKLLDTPQTVRSKSLGAMPASTVAKAARLALQRNARDRILSAGGHGLVLAGRFCPRLLDRILWTYGQTD